MTTVSSLSRSGSQPGDGFSPGADTWPDTRPTTHSPPGSSPNHTPLPLTSHNGSHVTAPLPEADFRQTRSSSRQRAATRLVTVSPPKRLAQIETLPGSPERVYEGRFCRSEEFKDLGQSLATGDTIDLVVAYSGSAPRHDDRTTSRRRPPISSDIHRKIPVHQSQGCHHCRTRIRIEGIPRTKDDPECPRTAGSG